ncbi:F-box domain-containing protein [Drechmeria coniospora]|uniref:F-box domain-containing protein n=1 Tax=Drechmeria coniospora TaxID=98403 RepID=A0A151GVK8_DRECN|nr:F-box domain-containing protein [Drechmeria coniospora]KYK61136.1 F-box domain-containing protein [Drechmeria coniospora]
MAQDPPTITRRLPLAASSISPTSSTSSRLVPSEGLLQGRRLVEPPNACSSGDAQPCRRTVSDRRPHQQRAAGSRLVLRSRLPSCPRLDKLPNEVLLQILGFLDVNDLLSTSRTSHLFRSLSLAPILHQYRLRRTRHLLPPLLSSPSRPSVADLMAQHIFLTHTSVVSRRLSRSLVSIRLGRRLAARPDPAALVDRSLLPKECVPGLTAVHVSPALLAKRKAVEMERVKDGLRRWVAATWTREVHEREEGVRRLEESRGVGRVWRLRRFWERVSKGVALAQAQTA